MQGCAVAVLTLLSVSAHAQATRYLVDGNLVYVVDGDTIRVPCQPDGCTGSEKIRVLNIDTPETRKATCENELILGLRAKEVLVSLIRGKTIAIDRCEANGRCLDHFGRTLARISVDGLDLGEALVQAGLAVSWKTGAKAKAQRKAVWCGQ